MANNRMMTNPRQRVSRFCFRSRLALALVAYPWRYAKKMNLTPDGIVVTAANVDKFPKIKQLLDDGKVRADSKGRLRYLHGAPVGRMVLASSNRYLESADEWFDPESPKAESFVWP